MQEVSIINKPCWLSLVCFRSSTFSGAQEWFEVNPFATLSIYGCYIKIFSFYVWLFDLDTCAKTWTHWLNPEFVSDHSWMTHQWWVQYRPSLITVTERYFLSCELALEWKVTTGNWVGFTANRKFFGLVDGSCNMCVLKPTQPIPGVPFPQEQGLLGLVKRLVPVLLQGKCKPYFCSTPVWS